MTSRRFFSSSTFRTDNLWTIFGDATVSLCHQTDVRGVWCGESSHLLLLLALQNSPGSPASLVSAFISSWLDYCNSLFSRLPGSAIQHVCKSTYTRRIENKKKSQMRRYLAKKMTLKVAWTVRIRRPAVTVEQADCSRLLDPRPRNSCRRVDCVSSEHWARWHQPSGAGGVRSRRSAGSRRPCHACSGSNRHELVAARPCDTSVGAATLAASWQRIITYKLCLFMHHIHIGQAPQYLSECVSTVPAASGRYWLRTTGSVVYVLPRTSTRFGERSYFYYSLATWNFTTLPTSVHSENADHHININYSATFSTYLRTFAYVR